MSDTNNPAPNPIQAATAAYEALLTEATAAMQAAHDANAAFGEASARLHDAAVRLVAATKDAAV